MHCLAVSDDVLFQLQSRAGWIRYRLPIAGDLLPASQKAEGFAAEVCCRYRKENCGKMEALHEHEG